MKRPGGRPLLLILALLPAACSRLPAVRPGSRIAFDYVLRDGDRIVDSTRGREPAQAVVGSGDLLPGLEAGLLGLSPGESRTVTLPPERAYGAVDPAAVQSAPLSRFGALAKGLKPGMTVSGLRGGKAVSARVVRVAGAAVLLDFNHPLAGKTLTYDVTVRSVLGP